MYFLYAYNNKLLTYKDFRFELCVSATSHLFQFWAEVQQLKGARHDLVKGGKTFTYWDTLVIEMVYQHH